MDEHPVQGQGRIATVARRVVGVAMIALGGFIAVTGGLLVGGFLIVLGALMLPADLSWIAGLLPSRFNDADPFIRELRGEGLVIAALSIAFFVLAVLFLAGVVGSRTSPVVDGTLGLIAASTCGWLAHRVLTISSSDAYERLERRRSQD
jgi:hypothetical protein